MKIYQKLLKDFEEVALGYMTLGIVLSSCLGSAAGMVILMNGHGALQMTQLFLVVSVCMGYNATVLAQLRSKYIFNALLLSLVVSTILLLFNVWLRY